MNKIALTLLNLLTQRGYHAPLYCYYDEAYKGVTMCRIDSAEKNVESSERKEKQVGSKRIILSIQSITGGGTISEMRGYHERFRGIP